MNITFINRLMGIRFGGGENFDLNIARALKKLGHNVRFIIGVADGYEEPINLEDEFEVVKVKSPYLRDYHYKIKPTNVLNKILSVGALELDLFLFERKVLKFLKNDEWTNIYQICGLPRLGTLLKRKYPNKVVSVRWPGPPSKRRLKWMKGYDINFSNGHALEIIKKSFDIECYEISPGVDVNKFHPIKKNNEKVKFLFVGRIIPVKNLSFLIKGFIEALNENRNLILNIVGDGEQGEILKIKRMIKGFDNIKFIGRKTGQELIKIYQSSDVFCITSKYENYPNVVLEAMACGLPVIATKVGGIPFQIVDGKTGILVELDNVEQLKRAILKLANDRKLREKLGKAGREKVEKEFNWGKSAEKLEKIYLEVLNEAKNKTESKKFFEF